MGIDPQPCERGKKTVQVSGFRVLSSLLVSHEDLLGFRSLGLRVGLRSLGFRVLALTRASMGTRSRTPLKECMKPIEADGGPSKRSAQIEP